MNKIPTAEDFMTAFDSARMPRGVSYQKEIGEAMIEFAKLHVEAQRRAISHTMDLEMNHGGYMCGAQKIVENAYPLTNIQ